ncbi:hypothetical protein [Bdellovibrio sp. HCB2-146]|uniref:hypothetical protein n=1 Tax=Bdellovibrio sp. HCB2-146 TaxID=3394362 RepID=UPI0039BD568B
MSRFGRTERLIFVSALCMLLAFSYFLYDDSLLFPKQNSGQMELIGDVAISTNDVRRKNLDTFSWIPAGKKDKIYQSDSIYTGDRSEAIIRLEDGTQIRIEPNSLITLNLKNGQMNLDLRYGNLTGEIASGASLTVKSGNEEFKLESAKDSPEKSKIQLNKSHSGNVDMKLLAGKAQLIDKKAKQELKKDAVVAVSKKGEVRELEKAVLVLKTPDNISWVRIQPDDPIGFEWMGKGDIARFELEVSPAEKFESVAISKVTKESQAKVVDPLSPGPYFWRLKAYNSNGQVAVTSETRKMQITNLAPPEIVTPVQASTIQLEMKVMPNEEVSTSTEIQWKAMSLLKGFTWQLSQDENFATIIKEAQTTELAAVTPKLTSGTYWVRVKGETEKKNASPWSQPVSFSLNLQATVEQKPDRPILITKKIQFTPPSGQDRNPAAEKAPKMAWKPVLQSKNYHIQVSKDLSFKDAQKFDATQTTVAWSQYRPGKYYYRVFARGMNGLVSDPSEVGTIDITSVNPILSPFKEIVSRDSAPTPKQAPVTWTEIPFAKSYLVQLDSKGDFASPQQAEYKTTSGTLTLPAPGRYKVRVQALDENNKPITDFSNIEEVLYSFRSPLAAPKLMEPFDKASVFLQTAMEPFIWLEWKKVEGATNYIVEVSDKEDFSHILLTKSQPGNRFLIKEKVPLGKLYWRVRAESKESTALSDWAATREFIIYHQKNETFVK